MRNGPPDAIASPQTGGSTSPSTADLVSVTRKLLESYGVSVSTNRLLRLVLRFKSRCPLANGYLFVEYLCAQLSFDIERRELERNSDELAYILTYFDPVGEEAVHNVMKEQRK
jgi:hypothetical protein